MDKLETQHLQYEVPPIVEPGSLGLAHNYSVLLSKLEKLAAFSENDREQISISQTIPSGNSGHHGLSDAEYSRVISDIWIGIVLTLLILSIVFFICSCFLYHKFQKWKHTYQTHSPEQPELSRRYDIDLESLPSYTICSGLPTYDDALDQFRKYGIIIQPPSVIKIFDESSNSKTEAENNDDNVSVNSTCTCGGGNNAPTPSTISFGQPNVIELNPDQLQLLSQKRLSLQIAVNSSIRRSGRSGRVDLCREVNRSNLLKSHDIPPIHRSASQQSLYHDRILSQRLRSLQHRGSLC